MRSLYKVHNKISKLTPVSKYHFQNHQSKLMKHNTERCSNVQIVDHDQDFALWGSVSVINFGKIPHILLIYSMHCPVLLLIILKNVLLLDVKTEAVNSRGVL